MPNLKHCKNSNQMNNQKTKEELIKEKLEELIELLNDMDICLTSSERRSYCSLGKTRTAFVKKTIETIKENHSKLPYPISTESLDDLFVTTQIYKELLEKVEYIQKKISDNLIFHGNETFNKAAHIRKRLEAATYENRELKEIYEELSIFLKNPGKIVSI